MSDRKPVGDLFDFPTGRGAGDSGRERSSADRRQADLFAEPTGADELAHPDSAEARHAPDLEAEAEQQDMAWPTEGDHAYDPVGADVHDPASGPVDLPGAEDHVPGVMTRWFSGAVDVALHLAVGAIGVGAMLRLGLVPTFDVWPGFVAFLLCFSFLYVTLPLAFWGQTPGMAWGGLQAFDVDGRSLTFVQAMLRWAAAIVTAMLLGFPLLIAISGRSLADRLSSSETSVLGSEPLAPVID